MRCFFNAKKVAQNRPREQDFDVFVDYGGGEGGLSLIAAIFLDAALEDKHMTQKGFEKEIRYQAMLSICRAMLGSGVISTDEFRSAERFLREKYQPIFSARC